MKKLFFLSLFVSLLIYNYASAYIVKKGDTPYGLWGSSWKTELAKYHITDPRKMPVGLEVNELLGARTYTQPQDIIASTGTIPVLYSDTIKTQETTVTNTYERIENGDFTDWNLDTVLSVDDWNLGNPGEGAPIYTRSTDKYAGNYALGLSTIKEFGGFGWLSSLLFLNGEAGESIQFSTYGKSLSGTNSLFLVCSYRDGESGYSYNFSGPNEGTFTLEGEEGPTADMFETKSLSGSYALKTFTSVTFPGGVSEPQCLVGVTGDAGDNTAVLDNASVLLAGIESGSNLGFESWTTNYYPDQASPLPNWDYYSASTSFNVVELQNDFSSYVLRSTDVPTTSLDYSAMFFSGKELATPSQQKYFYQVYSGTPGTLLDLSFWYKGIGYIGLFDNTTSTFTHYYNFEGDWIETSTLPYNEWPGTGIVIDLDTQTDWYNISGITTTIPDSGKIAFMFMEKNGGYMHQAVTSSFAGFSAIETEVVTTPANTINGLTIKNINNLTSLSATDTLFVVEDASSTKVLRIGGDANFKTDLTEFDFSNKPVAVGTPINGNHAATKDYVDTNIDYKIFVTPYSAELNLMSANATTSIYTVPSGYTFYPTGLIEYCTTATNPNMPSQGYIWMGTDPEYTDIQSIQGGSTYVGRYSTNALLYNLTSYPENSTIGVKVQTQASGYDAFSNKYSLIGYLVAN